MNITLIILRSILMLPLNLILLAYTIPMWLLGSKNFHEEIRTFHNNVVLYNINDEL